MRNEKLSICDDLQPVAVVHGVIGYEESFRSDEDKQRDYAKNDPEAEFEPGMDGFDGDRD